MPIFPCRLFQSVQMGEYFTITPVSIGEGIVDLQVVPSKGDRLMRAERFLQMLDEAWAQEEWQTLQTATSDRNSCDPGDVSGKDAST